MAHSLQGIAAKDAKTTAARIEIRAVRRNRLCCGEILLFFFRLLLRRGQPFQALQQLFLGHAVGRDLGIVGID